VNNNPKEELMNKLLSGVCLGAALLSAPAWSQGLQLAHNAAPGNPKAEASTKFAELVAEKTDGRVSIVVGESAQFGDDVEALTNMRLGTIAFSANSQGATSGVVPEFAVVGLPFLFKDLPQAWAVLDGPVGDELAEAAEAKGLVLLALWDNGIRHVSNNVRPIETPEDLAGIKLRTPPDPITVDIFEALGASPTPLPFSELYIALQQGVVDGQENPLMNIYSSKLFEVQKYISLTAHKYESTPLFASKVVFDGFSPEDQAAIREAAAEAGKLNREMSQKADSELRGEMEAAGVTFNEVDPAPFIEKTQGVYDEWHEQFPELVDLVKQEAAKAADGS
jgi:tripartite ATP-independent transporter DctP family solute receptor